MFGRNRSVDPPQDRRPQIVARGNKSVKYAVQMGVPKPKNLPNRGTGEIKYPLREMEVGGFFRVPREDFFPEGTEFDPELFDAKKFRAKIHQSVRNSARNLNIEASKKEGFDPETYVPLTFTVAALGDDEDNGFREGDIGVWRDT